MRPGRDAVSLRDWTRGTRIEPTVRIGIVLDQDALDNVHLRVPPQRYQLAAAGSAERTLEPGTPLQVRVAGDALLVRQGTEYETRAGWLRLFCRQPGALEAGAGVRLRDAVVGRGFHWQKRIDLTLTGVLELRPGQRGVVLINELPLEDYLAGVITAEMSGACPLEFLKAQCIVARSWLLALSESKHDDEPFDRCNDDCCQRYQGTADLGPSALSATRATRGCVLLDPADSVLDANYAKCCGGVSETPLSVWGVDKPGLTPIVDAPADAPERRFLPLGAENIEEYVVGDWLRTTGIYCSPNVVPPEAAAQYLGRVDEAADYFRWTLRYSRAELEGLLRRKLPAARDLAFLRTLRITERGVSGRAIRMQVEWEDPAGEVVTAALDSEYDIRAALHDRFLYSSAIVFHVKRDCADRIDRLEISGAGWGHGVGMCQIGALGMALAGIDYKAICQHYYPLANPATVYE